MAPLSISRLPLRRPPDGIRTPLWCVTLEMLLQISEDVLLLAPLAIFLLGMLLSPLDAQLRGKAAHLTALMGSTIGCVASVSALLRGIDRPILSFSVAPFAEIGLRIDPLSSYFLLVISLVGAAASLYAIGYLKDDHSISLGLGLNGFLAAMAMVIFAGTAFAFLFAWELMSLVSFFLVIHNSAHEDVRRAGYVYLVMTHASTGFLLAAFLILYAGGGSLDFIAMRASASALPPLVRDFVFLLALVAFGTKAGIIPLHVWLPRAHPAAPSHVSALMSGVMIKMAIYGLLRIGWQVLGPGPMWWGVLLLALGCISAVLGVLYALMEHDLKRLLAYHSVENIGIIFAGLGAAFMFGPLGLQAAASLALLAALYHVLNHAVFKALLFFGAGAVQHATHTHDLEALGGLIRRMPWTAGAFLVGAAAISALPPLNGFISEWLTFQSLLALGSVPGGVLGVGSAIAAGLLALTGGLAAFCFVKAFGISFLGMPRRKAAAEAREVSSWMLISMGFLALLCMFLGLVPGAIVRLLSPVTSLLAGVAAQPSITILPQMPSRGAGLAPLALLGFLIAFAFLGWVLARMLGGRSDTRIAPPWACGIRLEPSMQYTAAALAKPVRIIFSKLIRPYREIDRDRKPELAYFDSSVRYEAGIHPVYERYVYRPLTKTIFAVAQEVRAVQNGSLRTYLAYICVTLVVLLLLAR